MNYGLDDVLVAWSGVARAANSASGLRTSMERSAFADLFDSDVHFAALAGKAADVPQAADVADPVAAEPPVTGALAAPRSIAEEPAPTLSMRSSLPIATSSGGAAGGGPLVAPGSLVRLMNVPEGSAAGRAPARATLEPALCQWSRTALTACLRDGELNLTVRDGALGADRETVDVLRQALREMGIGLTKLKINGINAEA
ncbi:hypothetical protein [Solimonas sp. SE-A11]|uniref:hypothetical protein n=1 Tax=Solimonas sp. SE-A11 TaxID=3054954 RepID=UPI00259C702A|nr:hypothetical protein [Solimonas sp. SE-A11]MDM4772917.1 hypothetical protein [Solimonas sp. SE-A11]